MRNFRGRTWVIFIALSFMSILCTSLILMGIIIVLQNFGYINLSLRLFSFIMFFLLAVIIGTVVSAFFSRGVISPIRRLSKAMKRVSEGDLSVQVENDALNELGALTRDFNKMVRDLNGIETLRNDFIMNVSHEFKTPISSIEGCATLLQNDNLSPEERSEYLSLILDSSRRLSLLISNILNLSRLENQEIVSVKTVFRLDEQIRQSILMLEPQWSGKSINFDINLRPVTYFGSEDLFMQVWTNLIGNAIKFSHAGGVISVSLTQDAKYVTVRVSDEGIGMSPEIMHHIFDKFYQGDASRASQGNGLGLPMAKRILDMSGGSISVESAPDEGSLFTVRLPGEQARKNT